MNPPDASPAFTENARATRRKRLMGTAGQIAFLETQGLKHGLDDCDMLGLAAVRCARERQLLICPAECVEPTRLEKWHYLERLGARSPERYEGWIAGNTDGLILCIDDRGMDPVIGFHRVAAGNDYVEFVGCYSHARKIIEPCLKRRVVRRPSSVTRRP